MAKTTLYPSLVQPPPQPGVNVFDQAIFQRWTEPPKPKIVPRLAIALIASGLFAPVLNPNTQITQKFESRWHQGWSEPVRQKQGLRAYLQDYSSLDVPRPPPAPTVLQSSWHRPWSEPVRRKGPIAALQEDFFAPATTPAVVSTAIVVPTAWSNPPPQRRIILYQSKAAPTFTPAPVSAAVAVPSSWVGLPPYRLVVQYQGQAYTPFIPPAPDTTISLFPAWPEPVRVKRGLGAHLQQFLAWSGFTPAAPTVTDINWVAPWAEPVRLKKGLPAHQQQVLAWSNFVTPTPTDVVVPTTWSGPPPRIRSMQYQAWAAPIAPVTPAVVPSFGWFSPLADPGKETIKVSSSVSVFLAIENPDAALTNFWYAPWPDFAQRKKGLLAAQQQVLALNPTTPAPAVVTDIKWLYQWSEPVRTRKYATALQDTGAPDVLLPPPVLSSQWYEPWVDPVRVRRFPTAQQQDLAWYPVIVPPAAVTADMWVYQWSEPVRVRRFSPAQQQALAWYPVIVPPPAVSYDMWGFAWSEPVRQKKGIRVALQQQPGQAPIQPNLVRTINWYQPLSEPVRQKKGLRAWLQQFFDTDHNAPPQAPVQLVMSAFEINLDQLLFGIQVTNDVPPSPPAAVVGANVSIEEIPAIGGAAASIEET